MRFSLSIAALFLLAACSGKASKEDRLNAAADVSTPEAANVLEGAANNGMNEEDALNQAARAQAENVSANRSGRQSNENSGPQ